VIKVPDANPGLLFVAGQQKPFTLEGVWKSPVAPAPNMMVDVELDGSGGITGIATVDSQQVAKEKLNQLGNVAQEQGKVAAEMAKQGVGALAARMGKVTLGAAVAVWIAWFFLPGVTLNLGFLGSKSFTFWEFLGLSFNDFSLLAGGNPSQGLFGFIGLAAIAAPFAAPFVRHPQAKFLNVAPIAFVALVLAKAGLDISRAGEARSVIMEAFSLGSGTYLLLIAGAVLAFYALKGPAVAKA
jgi:hypothetical protein